MPPRTRKVGAVQPVAASPEDLNDIPTPPPIVNLDFDEDVGKRLETQVRAGTTLPVVVGRNAALKTQYRAVARYKDLERCEDMGFDTQLLLGLHFRSGQFLSEWSQAEPRRLNCHVPRANLAANLERDLGCTLNEWLKRQADELGPKVKNAFVCAMQRGSKNVEGDVWCFDREAAIRYFIREDMEKKEHRKRPSKRDAPGSTSDSDEVEHPQSHCKSVKLPWNNDTRRAK